jgi:meso-butanediol dehydrogenase / (S,S)-butanediol dehydrogenase / diacetyl reductase
MNDSPAMSDAVVFVTGGGSGIGRATAELAAERGAAVAVVDRHEANARETAAAIETRGGRALAFTVDVSDDGAVGAAVDAAASTLGRITGVVTAAGIFHGPDLAPIDEVGIADFFRVLAVNLGGTFSAIHHCLPLLADGGGAIVTIASTAAIRGHGFGPGYTASKGGVDALTRLVATQGGPRGVRANCICPGGIDTPMTGGTFATPEAVARARRSIPLQRYGVPFDIAAVACFLLSADAAYLTGQTIPVEGGSTIS